MPVTRNWMMLLWLLSAALLDAPGQAQRTTPASRPAAANLTLPAPASSFSAETLLDPEAPAWQQVPLRRVALNRTPPLYDTDPPAALEISMLEVRLARAQGKLLVHLAWRDPTRDTAALPVVPESPPERRNKKELTAATARFFDAAAVMFPAEALETTLTPSLQMGDPQHPVTIHYWNAARGALLMVAHGRETTRRTGGSFPARAAYRTGRWQVTFELPALSPGVPLAFAVWSGSQLDRDGRKYFSVWHWLE